MRNSLFSALVLTSAAGAAIDFSGTSVPFLQRRGGVTIADFDGGGRADLAVAVSDDAVLALNGVAVFTNIGGTFSGPVNLASGGFNADSVAIRDLDLDGVADIAATNPDSNTLSVLTNLTQVAPPRPADFDNDGGVDGADVEAFFRSWEAGGC